MTGSSTPVRLALQPPYATSASKLRVRLRSVEEVRDRERLAVAARLEDVDRDEPLGLREGERPQEHGADDA